MVKRSDAAKSNRSDFTAYFNPATRVPEPSISEHDLKRYDDLGVIGVQALTETGYFAGILHGKPAAPAKPPGETTVLVVDDDAGTVQVVQRVLKAAGYDTRAARTRAQIAEQLGRTPLPDLILLDVDLAPGLSGFNILNKLQQHEVLKKIPVILLTSMSGPEHIVKGLGLGATAYLTKPARPSVLVDAVRAVLTG